MLSERLLYKVYSNVLVTNVNDINAGYFKFLSIYQAINLLDNQSFNDFFSPTNPISRILVGHFLAIQNMMLPILDREWAGRTKNTPCRMNPDWMNTINEGLPVHMRHFMEWPTTVAGAVSNEISTGHCTSPKVSKLRKKGGLKGDVMLERNTKSGLSH